MSAYVCVCVSRRMRAGQDGHEEEVGHKERVTRSELCQILEGLEGQRTA